MFFVNTKGLVELVIFIPFFPSFSARPPVIRIKIFAKAELRNGEIPIAIPIPIEISVFGSINSLSLKYKIVF